MAHFDKAKTFVGNLSFHIDRKDDLEKSNKRKYENNIIKEKTHLNYDMNYLLRKDFQELSTMERYKKRLEELKQNQPLVKVLREDCELSEWQLREAKKQDDYDETKYYDYKHKEFRKDANTICFFVIQIPKDENGEYCFKTLEEQKSFFESTINFLSQKIGRENIINIQCHYDETTIHMHTQFIPCYEEKLNCKKILNKEFLQSFHSQLQKHLEEDLQRKDFSIFSNDDVCSDSLEMKKLKVQSSYNEVQQELQNKYDEKIEEYKSSIIDFQNYYHKKIEDIKKDYEERYNDVENIVNEKLQDLQNKYDKGKEKYNNMCIRFNEKKKQYDNLIELPTHSVVNDFRNMGKDNLLGGGRTFSKEEIEQLSTNIQRIETKYDYYSRNENLIEQLNAQHSLQIKGMDNKISILRDNIDKLEREKLELQMYKNFVDDS